MIDLRRLMPLLLAALAAVTALGCPRSLPRSFALREDVAAKRYAAGGRPARSGLWFYKAPDIVSHTFDGERRTVDLDLAYNGYGADQWGGVRVAFHAETLLHRNDFAINYNAMARAGVAAVGATVKIELDIEAVQGESLPPM